MGGAIHRSEGLADGSAGYLQMAREARGVSLEDAAASFGLKPEHLRAVEQAARAIPLGLVNRAALVYGLPRRFFERPMREELKEPREMFMCGEGIEPCAHVGCNYCAHYLCDYPLGKGETCDAALCEDHAAEQTADMHFCPAHIVIAERRDPW